MNSLSPKIINNIKYIIECSPLQDKYENHFILLSKHFIRCFYKDIVGAPLVAVKECTTYNYVYALINNINFKSDKIDLNTKKPDPLHKDLKKLLYSTYNILNPKDNKYRKPSMYLLWKGDCNKFDLNSAVGRLMDLIKVDPDNKYLFPLKENTLIYKYGGNVYVFSFLKNFKDDLKEIQELYEYQKKLEDNKKETVIKPEKPKVEKPIDSNKLLLDKLHSMVDNVDSLAFSLDLIKLADHILETFDRKGLNVCKLSKYYKRTVMIDDSCGYPLVKDIDDIPSPFPEDVEGDQKLANM